MTQYLAIDILIKGLTTRNDIWMRKVIPLTFTPMDGMRIKLCVDSEDEELEREFKLENIHYSCKENQWIEEQEDSEVFATLRECTERIEVSETITNAIVYYERLGFTRLNFPQGQVVRNE